MMGVSAAVTVFFTILSALTLTPATLLLCPSFFESDTNFGFNCKGFCCSRNQNNSSGQTTDNNPITDSAIVPLAAPDWPSDSKEATKSTCWTAIGRATQVYAIPIVALLFAIAIPLGVVYLPKFDHALGLVPMLPRGSDATDTMNQISTLFGETAIFPMQMLIVPDHSTTVKPWEADGVGMWMHQLCNTLMPLLDSTPGIDTVFTGAMTIGGSCLYNSTGQLPEIKKVTGLFTAAEFVAPVGNTSALSGGTELDSLKVSITVKIDIFSQQGQDWIKQFRIDMNNITTSPEGQKLLGEGGQIALSGEGCTQLDNTQKAYDSFPLMVGLMMTLVLIVIGAAFRSIVAPVRAVLCLLWMLAITFGFAIAVYQCGALDFIGWESMHKRDLGAMYWMAPLMAFSIVVGLGLDYDIFYSERVLEECHNGLSESEAAVKALEETANIISAAGIIMVMAFFSLLVSTTAALNEIAFLLIVGIICDCFVSTKLIIPASIALLDGYNFWPSKPGKATPGPPEGWKLVMCGRNTEEYLPTGNTM